MDNFLNNGTVLPNGLLSHSPEDFQKGFNRTYQNTALRVGMIANIYPVNSPKNISKLTTEYDVTVIQQDSNQGIASVNYKNCMSAEGFGSIADFFERNLRARSTSGQQDPSIDFKGQNGAIVLLMCLDALTEKAIIISALTHPDRTTTLIDAQPRLAGQYNGVSVLINPDGSTSLTFAGATDNNGVPLDASQGNTVVSIATDGSFQIKHSTITLGLAKSGVVTLNATSDVSIQTQTKLNITTSADTIINATGKVTINGSETDVQGNGGTVLTNKTDPVIDSIFGEPTMGVPTFKAGN